jgi:hypothetical protein
MIETIEVKIDGVKFFIQQFSARECIRLEKKTITYISPILNVIDGASGEKSKSKKGKSDDILEKKIDFSKLASSIQNILLNLTDDEFEEYIFRMIKNVFYLKKAEKGEIKRQIDEDEFDELFVGKSLMLYKLLIEIMKVNKFAFFELMGGAKTSKIFG